MQDRLLHTKVSKKKPLNHFPKKEDGHDGDMQIVSIQGKGTYLCLKDKGDWKISEKFNPKNKFDTHIFDEITTKKIRGKGGLGLTLQSESVTSKEITAATGGGTETTTIQPVLKVGDGTNQGVISSLNGKHLVLQSATSTPSQISLSGVNNHITAKLNSTSQFQINFDIADVNGGMFRIYNGNSDATADASINIETNHTNADPFVRYIHRHGTPSSQVHWAHGMDGSDSDKFKLNYFEGATLVNPSTSTGTNFQNVLTMTKTGDVTVGNDLNVTGDAVVDGGNLTVDVSSGDPKIHLQIGGSTKYTIGLDDSDSDLFKINSGSTIADPSDFEMDSSGNVVVAGTLTSSKGLCSGTTVPFVLTSQFQDDLGTNAHYIPIAGYFEQALIGNEPAGFIAPFAMELQKVAVRCSEDISGGSNEITIGMWAINSGATHGHHHTSGKNWAKVAGREADVNAIIDFTGTVGLAASASGGSNAITAGQWVDFSIQMSSDETSSNAEFWITFYFTANMSSTI